MKALAQFRRAPAAFFAFVAALCVWTVDARNAAYAATADNAAPTGLATPESGGDAAANALASASVEPSTGVLRASYPFHLPTARGRVQPTLGLSYGSTAGVREAGYGWGLSLPVIERRHPSGNRGSPTYVDPPGGFPGDGDRLVFDGQPLVLICAVVDGSCGVNSSGATPERMPPNVFGWSYFRLEVEGLFARFFWSGDKRTWLVQLKSGETMELGVPYGGGDEQGLDRDGARGIFRWNVVRRYDAYGSLNRVEYAWAKDLTKRGVGYLTDIFDTPSEKNEFAHRTHLDYEAPPDLVVDYSPRWHAVPDWRLTTVTMTSASRSSAARELVRRYHLNYGSQGHQSFLLSVQLEGRCGPTSEATALATPQIICDTLPPTTMEYGGRSGSAASVWNMQGPVSLAEGGDVSIVDVNGDGLPDIVAPYAATPSCHCYGYPRNVCDPKRPNPCGIGRSCGCVDTTPVGDRVQTVYLSSIDGHRDSLTPVRMAINPSLLGATPTTFLSRSAPGRSVVGDWFADGRANVLWRDDHSIALYSPYDFSTNNSAWVWWGGLSSSTVPPDFTHPAPGTSQPFVALYGDVDADGLTDLVGSYLANYLSMRSADGSIQPFAHVVSHPLAEPKPGLPPSSCGGAPAGNFAGDNWDSSSGCVGPSALLLADLNGDGLPDRVSERMRFRSKMECVAGGGCQVVDWLPYGLQLAAEMGNGDGTFQGSQLYSDDLNGGIRTTEDPPNLFADYALDFRLLHDVTGDGLADVVVAQDDGIIVHVAMRRSDGTPTIDVAADRSFDKSKIPGWQRDKCEVRAADMDASGTDDIVVICPQSVVYKSFDSDHPRHLLSGISNGRGALTDIEYASTSAISVDLRRQGFAWASNTPQPIHVVTKVTTRNSLPGTKEELHAVAYEYVDPVYDGLERSFRGFKEVTTRQLGQNPANVQRTRFLVGHCEDDNQHGCPRTIDRPREALRGLPVLTETSASTGDYLSTTHTTYRLHVLFTGLDGRKVRFAWPEQTDSFIYDGAPATSPSISLVEINATEDPVLSHQETVPLRASGAHTQITRVIDDFGNEREVWDRGRIDAVADPPTHTIKDWNAFGAGGWAWRVTTSFVDGAGQSSGKRYVTAEYDSLGQTSVVNGWLDGIVDLDRHHEDPAGLMAPKPSSASTGAWVKLASYDYTSFGNVARIVGASGHCTSTTYDALFGQLPTSCTAYVGVRTSQAPCGERALTTLLFVDRGIEATAMTVAPTGATTTTQFDGFGRPTSLWRPPLSSTASVLIDYVDPVGSPARVRTTTAFGPASFQVHTTWRVIDGFGQSILQLDEADRSAGDEGDWIVSGLPDRDALGRVVRSYLPGFYTGDPAVYSLARSTSATFRQTDYDNFGHVNAVHDVDGKIVARSRYRGLAVDSSDEQQLAVGLKTTTYRDGHGRVVRVRRDLQKDFRQVDVAYQATGEIASVTQSHQGGAPVVRWMQYDSFGRMVLNAEPNTSTGFSPDPTQASGMKAWRYVYDDAGELVATSDARGCGENFYYDAGGRLVAEDFSPCLRSQPDYSPPAVVDGNVVGPDGSETFNVYDAPEPGQTTDYGGWPVLLLGHLSATTDRATHTRFAYDIRGRTTGIARQIAKPGPVDPIAANRYAPTWYRKAARYDDADRETLVSTGADVPALMGSDGQSLVAAFYSARGVVSGVWGSYGTLLEGQQLDADGFLRQQRFGDKAKTHADFTPDLRRRLGSGSVTRTAPQLWSDPVTHGYRPPGGTDSSTLQTALASNVYDYDPATGELRTIIDSRISGEWPTGAKPVRRGMVYNELSQLSVVNYDYMTASKDDAFEPPLGPEAGSTDIVPSVKMQQRIRQEVFEYDFLGNTTASVDDKGVFWDRGLGPIVNGTPTRGPNQLVSAGATGAGTMNADYDPAGNLTGLTVRRDADCATNGATESCSQRYVYDWDEVGRLARARRWDFTARVPPAVMPNDAASDLTFANDAGGARVLKVTGGSAPIVSADIFATLRLERAAWNTTAGDYDRNADTEHVYLAIGGASYGRLLYASSGLPTLHDNPLHVLLEVGDHLGSTSIVVDQATSELVERTTYQAFGATESDYRPSRWQSFREDFRFTGKLDDKEVGLTYFGARYYSAALGRWMSSDPLTIHGLGADLNPYAYVGGSPLTDTDANGLCDSDQSCIGGFGSGSDSGGPGPLPLPFGAGSGPPGDVGLFGPQGSQGSGGGGGIGGGPWTPPRSWAGDGSGADDWKNIESNALFANSATGDVTWTPQGTSPFSAMFLGSPVYTDPMGDALKSCGLCMSIGQFVVGANPITGPLLGLAAFTDDSKAWWERGLGLAAVIPAGVIFRGMGAIGRGLRAFGSSSSFVYQLVDHAGDVVYYGISENPLVRLGAHSRLPPGPFAGMQLISEGLPLAQAEALETSLIQQAGAEGRTLYNVSQSSVLRGTPPGLSMPSTVTPLQTLLNPKLYAR